MQAYALTDVGRSRNTNQDYLFAGTEPIGLLPNLFIVADGMGGHKAGDFASRFAVEALVSYIDYSASSEPVEALTKGIWEVNHNLFNEAHNDERLAGMGTTLVAAVIEGSTLYAANIGDSRLYLIGQGIRQITKDHSFVEEMVSIGQMERNSPDYLSKKNIITRAVGTGMDLTADFFEVSLQPGDYILLCSDGLTNMVDDAEIAEIVLSPIELKEKAERLIALANANGGKDNIAVVLVNPQISEVKSC